LEGIEVTGVAEFPRAGGAGISREKLEVPRGAILQRDKKTYAIVPRLGTAGLMDVGTLRRLADVAEEFSIPVIKITGAQRIALVGLKAGDVEEVWNRLNMEPAPAVGPCVHYVTACPGTVACSYGRQDALGLAGELEKRHLGQHELGSKFKIGISGCPMNCCEAYLRDFGAFGKAKGWTVTIGGRAGARPRIADTLVENVSSDEVMELAEKTIRVYAELGKKGERLGTSIERIGFEEYRKRILG